MGSFSIVAVVLVLLVLVVIMIAVAVLYAVCVAYLEQGNKGNKDDFKGTQY